MIRAIYCTHDGRISFGPMHNLNEGADFHLSFYCKYFVAPV